MYSMFSLFSYLIYKNRIFCTKMKFLMWQVWENLTCAHSTCICKGRYYVLSTWVCFILHKSYSRIWNYCLHCTNPTWRRNMEHMYAPTSNILKTPNKFTYKIHISAILYEKLHGSCIQIFEFLSISSFIRNYVILKGGSS